MQGLLNLILTFILPYNVDSVNIIWYIAFIIKNENNNNNE